MSGSLTLNENIADNGGILMAYRAYKASEESDKNSDLPGLTMNEDQLYFLGFSQV